MSSGVKGFIAGVGLGALVMAWLSMGQYAKLKRYGDSVAVASARADSQVHTYSDSIKVVIAKLAARRQTIVTKVDTSGLVQAKATVRSLAQALAIADSMTAAEKTRADSAIVVVETLNRSIKSMSEKINSLHGTPTWLKIGGGVLGVAATALVTVKVIQILKGPQ